MKEIKIMVVEDETVIAMNIEKLLDRLGYNVVARTSTGEDAVRMADDLNPDLILMDIMLAGKMDGIEAAKLIRDRHNTPVIYLTGNADALTISRARETEPFGYVLKPFTVNHLFSTIDTAMNRSELESRLAEKGEELERANEELSAANEELETSNEDLRVANEELYLAHEALIQSERKYRELYENMQDGIAAVDDKGFIQECNTRFLEMIGYTFEEAARLTYRDITPEKWHDNEMRILKDQVDVIGFSGTYRKEYIRKDGMLFPVELTTYLRKDKAGANAGYWAIVRDITERTRSEDELRKSEERNRTIVAALPDLFFQIDADHRFLDCRASRPELLLFPPDQVIGRRVEELLPPWLAELTVSKLEAALGTGAIQVFEYILPIKGEDRYFESRMTKSGRDSVLAIIRDITDRKLAEAHLKENEERYRHLFEQAPFGIGMATLDGRVLAVNKGMETITGYTEEEYKKTNLADTYVNPKVREELLGILKKSGIVKDYPVRLRRRDGSVYDASISIGTVKIGGKDLLQTLVQDVTEKKRTEDELRKREEEIRLLAENAPEIIARFDRDLRHTYINLAAEKATGIPKQSFIGKTNRELGAPEDLVTFWDQELRAVFENREKKMIEYTMPTLKGPAVFEANLVPELAGDGSVESILIISRDVMERKRAEQALRESEERYRALVENSLFGIGIVDGITVHYANKAAIAMFGYDSFDDFSSADLVGPLPPHSKTFLEEWRRKKAGGEEVPMVFEFDIIRKDSETRTLRINLAYIQIMDKTMAYATFIDVTERKLAEHALKESEEKLKMIIDHSNELFYIHDVHYNLQYVSPQSLTMFGYSPDDTDVTWYKLLTENPVNKIGRQLTREAIKTGKKGIPYELELYRKDGSRIWIEVDESPILDAGGKVIAITGAARDITKRKQAEDSLKESEEKLKMIIDHSNEFFYIHDVHHKLFYASPQSERMLGYTPEEMLIEWPKLVTDNPINAKGIEITEAAISTGKTQKPYELELYRKNGEKILIEIDESPIIDSYGKVVAITGAARDITERKRTEDQVKAALQEKDVLLREIHHRVKNNFQIISSLIDLQTYGIEDSRLHEKFRDTGSRIRAMALIHEKLYQTRNYSRIEFRDFISEITVELINGYKTGENPVAFSLDANEVNLTIDQAIPCGLIINELMTNSLKHAFPQGWKGKPQITVSLRDSEGEIELAIADNGVGLPKGSATKTPQTFGRSLVPMLVNQIGGRMKVQKTNGTRYIITFRKK